MTRYNEGGGPSQLEDFEPYPVRLARVEPVQGQYGLQLQLDWELSQEMGGGTVRDWVDPSALNVSPQTGKVSKARAMLNAIAGRPEATRIVWVDDGVDPDTGRVVRPPEWSYDGGEPYGALTPGLPVILRGKNVEGKGWRVQVYQPVRRSAQGEQRPVASSPRQPSPQRRTNVQVVEQPVEEPEPVAETGDWDPDQVPF